MLKSDFVNPIAPPCFDPPCYKTVIDKDTQHKILKYFVIYAMILLALIFIVSLDSNDFLVVTSAVFSCFNNIGPILGTTSSFAIFSPISKFSSPLQWLQAA